MNKIRLTLLALILMSPQCIQAATDCATVTQIPSTECEALVALYNSTNSDNWEDNSGWLENNTPCSWYGVTCSGGHVLELNLSENGLIGTIPSELGNLSNLTWLSLSINSLTGSIPSELGNLSNLTRLYLSSNSLTGTIPSELGNLSNLMSLSLSNNSLTGTIPTELGNLNNLMSLSLSNNSLTSSIPTELGNLSNLSHLYLSSNSLTSSIPTELGNLSNLRELDLSSNSLTGSIPIELSNLSNLTKLYLSSNQLCGEIPVELKKLSLIYFPKLKLNRNKLIAYDAELIAWLDNREPNWDTTQTSCSGFFLTPIVKVAENAGTVTLTVQRNGNGTLNYATIEGSAKQGDDYIGATGTINWSEGDVKSFTITINDDSNSEINETFTITLTDPVSGEHLDNATVVIKDDEPADCMAVTQIPSTECEILIALYNSTNGDNWENHSGWNETNMPCSWHGVSCNGKQISKIDLHSNDLTGSIPTELGNLSNLTVLYLSSNKLTGSIPTELGNLSNLTSLNLHSNDLTGSIPAELGNLSNLTLLDLRWNSLTGTIPTELGNMSKLRVLSLSSNKLTGTIPTVLSNLSNLKSLNLESNELTGTIPSELGNLSNLESLSLSSNELTGTIPTELGNLSNLERLYLFFNSLTGSIPRELGNLSNLERLALSSNKLTGTIPTELGNMSKLRGLSLSSNKLTGTIPTVLSNLSNLKSLNLESNELTGTIPSELGNLSNLSHLYLSSNELTGTIPSELGNLSNLSYLYLSSNELTGSIPSELGNLINLKKFYLDDNQLCGEIPPELKNLSKIRLPDDCYSDSCIDIDNNHLTATDAELIAWLDSRNPSWDTTQTSCSGFFLTPIVKVAENAGTVTLTVQRNGNGTLNYATIEGSARQGYDYIGATGTINWSDGDVKSFTITINDDSNSESNETFAITLTDPVSEERLDNATVIIKDDEPTDCTAVTQIPSTECEILIALYNSTNGDNWENHSGWNETNTPCSWHGVSCNGKHVSKIDLESNSLTGTIPSQLGNLSNLTKLYLYNNSLTGSIPTELGNLSKLWRLHLSNNSLTGSIPTELGNLNNLEGLYLSNNSLTGSIPTELGNLNNLEGLYLSNNSLTGSIPTELGNLNNLEGLSLYNNSLTGTIPSELGNLSKLWGLHLSNNSLTGSIPTELGNLSNLRDLSLDSNKLTGTIPSELGNLSNLRYLSLNDNELTGTIPSELGNLSNLSHLYLSSNSLTGSIPSELGNLSNLSYLYLSSNSLTGTIPTELGNLSKLWYLLLHNNQLCGEIPPELKNLSKIRLPYDCYYHDSCLDINNNHLIPPNVGTTDTQLIEWLNTYNPGWETTQTPCPQQQCKLQLTSATYSVVENEGQATITVTRTDSSDGAVTIDYATTDDSATSPDDYTQTSGTLNWNDGEDEDKTFTIDINNDNEVESDETLIVSLGNPTGGAELGEPDTATVTITDNEDAGALIKGSVELQGREPKPHPSWETEIQVSFTVPSETQPRYSFTTTTDQNGEFEIGPVEPLEYDIRIKGTHTLQKLVSVSLTPGENLVNVGVLLEGDTNDDNCVTILDFSKLAGTFGKCEGDSGFDSQTDFNQDGCVTILDFSLLGANFGQCGASNPSMMVSSLLSVSGGSVVMGVVPSTSQVKVGETFEIVIEVQAGEQEVDGASAYLEFDPTLLEVVNMTSGDHLNLTLENSFDNGAGSINFAAGKLTAPFPYGDFELVTIRLRAKTDVPSSLVFRAGTDVTFGGASVLDR